MIQLVLIRPGATLYDEQGRIQGTLDVPLSSEGQQQVDRLVDELRGQRLDMVYHAPCEAAKETAARLGEALGVKYKKLDTLQNLNHGLWQGMLVEEVKHKQPRVFRQWQEQPETVCPPEGEMVNDAQHRFRETWRKLLRKHEDEVIGLVVPEPLASLVRTELSRCGLGDLWKAVQQTGRWELIRYEPEIMARP